LLEERIGVEKRKRKEFEAQSEKERLELLSQQNSLKEGQRVAFDVLSPMRTQIEKQEEKAPIEELKIVSPFEQKLQVLQSMGFVDREQNIKLLLQHKGELDLAIQDLLN